MDHKQTLPPSNSKYDDLNFLYEMTNDLTESRLISTYRSQMVQSMAVSAAGSAGAGVAAAASAASVSLFLHLPATA